MHIAKENTTCLLIHDLLFGMATNRLHSIALEAAGTGEISYADLAAAVKQAAKRLRNAGVMKGQHVAIILPNSADVIITAMACSYIGAVFIILNQEIRPFHLDYILKDAGAVLVVTDINFSTVNKPSLDASGVKVLLNDALRCTEDLQAGGENDEGPVKGDGNAIACLIYTSGSTGMPKAVVSRHHQVLFAVRAISKRLQYAETDVIGCVLPFSFDYGFYQCYLSFYCGAKLVIGSQEDVGPLLLKRLAEWKITCLPLSPVILRALTTLLERRRYTELPPLRMITNTGGYLPHAQLDTFISFFPQCGVYLMYGLTECKRVSVMLPEEFAFKRYSVGRPLDGTACYVVDESGNLLPPGEIGELLVTGPHVMSGYWKAEALTQKRFRVWNGQYTLFTGDQCAMDEDGYIYFHGRADDIFKHNGFRVSSLEIEKAANDIPLVTGSAIVIPRTYGDPLVLFITGTERDEAKITEELAKRIEPFKMPDRIIFIDTFPLTANGKTDKEKLNEYITRVSV